MDFNFLSLSLSFSPVTTGVGVGDRRARPGSRRICDLSFYRNFFVICDLWRLEVEEEWRLLDLNPMVKKIHVLKLHKTHGCAVDRLLKMTDNSGRQLQGSFL